jgi:hypothetical protein
MELRIFIAVIITLAVLAVTIKNYQWGLYVFVFLCPILPPAISLYINDDFPLITFQRVMLVILGLVWGVKYLTGKTMKIEKPPLMGLLFVFIGVVFVSSLLAPQPKLALKEFLSERWIGIPVLFFLAFQTIRDANTVKRIINLMIISSLIVCIFGIIEFVTRVNVFFEIGRLLMPQGKLAGMGFSASSNGFLRMGIPSIQSSFPIFTGLAAYVVFIIPLVLAVFYSIRMALSLSILLGALFLTISLGGYIIIGLVLVILWPVRPSIKIRTFLLYFIMIILLFSFTKYTYKEYDSSPVATTDIPVIAKEGGFARFWQGIAVLKTSLNRPLLGAGLGAFSEVVEIRNSEGLLLRKGADGYSYQQVVLVETGIPAFLIMCLFWWLLLGRMRSASGNLYARQNNGLYDLNKSMFAAIIGNLILSCVSISLLNTHTGVLVFWVSTAIAMRLWVISNNRSELPAESA